MKTKGLRRTLITALVPISAMLASTNAFSEDLMDIYRLAAESDPQLRAAEANRDAISEGLNQSKALYYPNISLTANAAQARTKTNAPNSFSDGDYHPSLGYSLNLSQALYRRDYRAQKDQTGALVQQAEAQYSSAGQALILRAAQRYFDVLAAQDSLDFALAEKEAISRQLEQTKQRFEVGLIAITDVHESQAAYDLAVASEIAAQNQLAIAHEALREVTGQLTPSIDQLGENMQLISPEPAELNQWVEKALEQNHDVMASKAAVEAAREQLSLQRSDRSPELDLVASHSFSDAGSAFGDIETTSTSIGVQLSIPLYQGGAIPSRIRQAQFQLNQAKDGLEQQRRAVHRTTSDAYLSVQANISRVMALKQAVVSSNSALEATEAGYDVGTRTTVDVLDARRNLFRAQRDYSRARYDYIISTLRLKQAAGILAQEDLGQINTWLN